MRPQIHAYIRIYAYRYPIYSVHVQEHIHASHACIHTRMHEYSCKHMRAYKFPNNTHVHTYTDMRVRCNTHMQAHGKYTHSIYTHTPRFAHTRIMHTRVRAHCKTHTNTLHTQSRRHTGTRAHRHAYVYTYAPHRAYMHACLYPDRHTQ